MAKPFAVVVKRRLVMYEYAAVTVTARDETDATRKALAMDPEVLPWDNGARYGDSPTPEDDEGVEVHEVTAG